MRLYETLLGLFFRLVIVPMTLLTCLLHFLRLRSHFPDEEPW